MSWPVTAAATPPPASARVSDTVIAVAISGLLTLCGIWYTHRQTYRAAARTAEIESHKVDAQAYERARAFDQSIVDGLRSEVTRLSEQITACRAELERVNTERDAMRRDRDGLRNELDGVERTLGRLLRLIEAADITLPHDIWRGIPPAMRRNEGA